MIAHPMGGRSVGSGIVPESVVGFNVGASMYARSASAVTQPMLVMGRARRTRLEQQPRQPNPLEAQSRRVSLSPVGSKGHNERPTSVPGPVPVQWSAA